MGSKGNQVKSSQTYTPNPQIAAAGSAALGAATDAAQTPFNAPLQPIAGFTPDQLQSFQQVRDIQGMTNPYFAAAGNYMNQSAAPITGADVSQYYNPMANNVFAQMNNTFGQQRAATTGNLTQQAGGVGADRIAVGQSELANQQGLAAGQTAAGLYGQALTAAQQQKQMAAGAGYGMGQLGGAAQAAALGATGALGQTGGLQQQLSQAQLNAPYQQQLQQQAYPYQQAQYLASITGSLAPAMGGTTNSQTTYPTPSPLSQVLGLGTAAMGLGGMSGMFGGTGGKGGTAGYPTAGYNGQPQSYAPWGAPSANGFNFNYGYKRGGSVPRFPKKAEGGPSFPGVSPTTSFIPNVSLQTGGGHSGLLTGGISDLPMPKGMLPQDQLASEVKAATGFTQALQHAADWGDGHAEGGAVNPYDAMKGFADGGDADYAESDFSPLDAKANVGREYSANEFSPLDASSAPPEQRDYPTKDEFLTGLQNTYGGMNPGVTQANAEPATTPSPFALAGNNPAPFPATPSSMAFAQPPVPTSQVTQPPAAPAPQSAGYNRGPAAPQLQNPLAMQEGPRPYPGARDRNWGQDATRSPWMSLVKAGATMANSIGPIGSVIGKGMAAGAGELESQRKALQSEEGINQKAQSLYQQAKHHLDQYTKMTPYQKQSLGLARERMDKEKYTPVNYENADGSVVAASYNPKTGTYHGEDGAPLTGGKIIARQSGAQSATSRATEAVSVAKTKWALNPTGDINDLINSERGLRGLPPFSKGEQQQVITAAKAAIAAGKDPEAVKARLQAAGYDTSGL